MKKEIDNISDPWILLLMGLPASGKTTIVKEIFGEDYYNEHVVSTDKFIEDKAEKLSLVYSDVFEDYISQASKEMYSKRQQLLNEGKNIIWDQTNLGRRKRKKAFRVNDNYKKILLFVDIDEKNREQQSRVRYDKTSKLIPYHIIEEMKNNLVKPTEEELEEIDLYITITS